jgi:hypothetical protein
MPAFDEAEQRIADRINTFNESLAGLEWTPVKPPRDRAMWQPNDIKATAEFSDGNKRVRVYRTFNGRYLFDAWDTSVFLGQADLASRLDYWKNLGAKVGEVL